MTLSPTGYKTKFYPDRGINDGEEQGDEFPADIQSRAAGQLPEAAAQQNHWTQDALARRIGIKQATLSNFENHPDKTTLTTLFKILQSLGVVMTLNAKAAETAPAPDNNTDLDW